MDLAAFTAKVALVGLMALMDLAALTAKVALVGLRSGVFCNYGRHP